jgi:hypothetical protein
MRKLIFACLALAACNSAPKGFCECLEKSEKLNKVANEVLKGDMSENKKKALLNAREEKAEVCKGFALVKGTQMQKWKRECENQ